MAPTFPLGESRAPTKRRQGAPIANGCYRTLEGPLRSADFVGLGSTAPSNGRCRRFRGTAAVGRSATVGHWRSLTSLANLHVGLLSGLQRIVDLDAEIPKCAFKFRVPEQQL